ncbi:PD40 domain-containing protein [Thermomonospora umbrina]|uniref:WD40 repeat protein n=1 Tax=Thermomonospora umbrina TaxID=111806 RepID=A0A3D9T3J6_9ACTN|nr:PD40 domain-containing protein [Thermomonospora umbrina]REE99334.1 WD40 repeat protein [Thermomonospora umbrina]
MRDRVVAAVIGCALLTGIAVEYTVRAAHRGRGPAASAGSSFDLRAGRLVVRDMTPGPGRGRISAVAGSTRTSVGPRCVRFHAAAGTGVCLNTDPGPIPRTYAAVLDRTLREARRVPLPGVPSRARVSASGRMIAWTVFVQGDSYTSASFSTRTGILDTRTGRTRTNIEDIPLTLDGHRHTSPDVNYWGVTFARDDTRFYATVSTKGRTHLVEGDYARWTARTLRENAECPSLAPDGRRLVYKKRVSADPADPWRLYVLDLRTMRETRLAERRTVDDQAAWLDDRTVMYARPRGAGGSDVWAVPADGSGAPRILVPDAASPVLLR